MLVLYFSNVCMLDDKIMYIFEGHVSQQQSIIEYVYEKYFKIHLD